MPTVDEFPSPFDDNETKEKQIDVVAKIEAARVRAVLSGLLGSEDGRKFLRSVTDGLDFKNEIPLETASMAYAIGRHSALLTILKQVKAHAPDFYIGMVAEELGYEVTGLRKININKD